MKQVVVIGSNHHNTLGVLWALGDAGIKHNLILVANKEKSFVSASKYPSKILFANNYDDVLYLLKSSAKEWNGAVVIACFDEVAALLDENYDELSRYYVLPGCPIQGELTRLMDKTVQSELAVEAGLRIPSDTIILNENIDTEKLEYPCLLKQIATKDTGKYQVLFQSQKELDNYIKTENPSSKTFLQSFIDKEFEYQLIGCSIPERGGEGKIEVIIPGFSKILRPCLFSNTSFLHYSELNPDLCDLDACRRLIQKTGYKGLFSIEFLRGKDGADYFMEINFRNDGNAVCVTAAGVNLPAIWTMACSDIDYSIEATKKISPVYCMPEFNEFRLLLHHKITIKEFLSDLHKTNRFMDYYKKDSAPFRKEIFESIKTFLHHKLHS